MKLKRRTADIQDPMHLPHCPLIRCSRFSVRCSTFLLSFFVFVIFPAFCQSKTNALPTLLPPYGQMRPTFWEQHGTAILAGGLILMGLVAAGVWRILKPRPRPVLPPAIAAREALARCRVRPEDGNILSEVSQVLRRYIGAMLEFPDGELTTAELCRELEGGQKITPQLTHSISGFLRACDERKFSPAVSSAPLDAAGRALEFIILIEKDTQRREHLGHKK
jgi:hypothetical protein